MNKINEERKKQVAHIIEISNEYNLVVDDKTVNEPFHLLFWEHQDNNEKQIHICLNRHTGELIELDIDDEEFFQNSDEVMSAEKAKEIADSFIKQYIPQSYEAYTAVYVKEWRGKQEVHYSQEVNGYSLPHTGCKVRIHPYGRIIKFRNHGVKEKPVWPASIVEKEIVVQQLKKRQDMRLVFAHLLPELYEYESGKEASGYRLVYEPVPSIAFIDACTGKDKHDKSHYESAPTIAVSAPKYKQTPETDIYSLLALEERGLVKVSEEDSDTEKKMVFAPKESLQGEQEDNEYSLDAFSKKHLLILRYGNPVMVRIDKKTNVLLHYFSHGQKEGKETLTREQCLEKALQFLGQVIPNAEQYLRLWDNYDEEDSLGRFHFDLYINGIQINSELVMIHIDAETGDVTMYSGVSPSVIEELLVYETNAKIRKEQALKTYRNALRVELEWFDTGDDNQSKYELIYKQTTTESSEAYHIDYFIRREMRYIDAHTGEIIWSK
ncbi:DUF4901 domain-containing protein [Bacillus sp. DX1.1]|uniref:YcdB/YcdC domain-containing protein n=1 Tax=unclassified Bacillus (in: firmicutes) TaxID=185979 RepID=UPI0025710ED7|nr:MULTISPECIES: YcdB/YcdC domain-containing protein [unclassified Bacillus (in: firmicutes)]MDM5156538.1 DUF4901 domain-containing protein [Bacillus sp. DX1.1]WJE80803.1 DUF4901 domain-containing protein [Bacillus sp. DX3.1]